MRRFLPLLVFAAGLSACASGTGRFGRVSEEPVLFPSPPDTARIQFLAAVSNGDDTKGVQDEGWFASVLDDPTQGSDGIVKPYGVAHFAGRIYICDTMLPGVEIIDVRARTFRRWRPTGRGTLRKPVNCTIDHADGSLYVADSEREQVVVFDSTLAYVDAFGESEGAPTDVVVDGDLLWVADIRNSTVNAYDKRSRELVLSIPGDGAEGDAVLRQPTNLWVHGDEVYVSDFGDFGVKVFTKSGEYVRRVGSFGRVLGQFVRPKGISTDRDGNLYVVDAGFENVQVFNPQGELLMFFGGPYSGPGTMWLPAKVLISYEDLDFFQDYVDPAYELKHLILVTNQYGPDRLTLYGFIERWGTEGG